VRSARVDKQGGRAKYERDIGNGSSSSSGSDEYDCYCGFLCSLALEVLDTTEALGAFALGEGGGALDVGAIDLWVEWGVSAPVASNEREIVRTYPVAAREPAAGGVECGESALGGLAVGNGGDVGLHVVLAALENSSVADERVSKTGTRKVNEVGTDEIWRHISLFAFFLMRGGGRRRLWALGFTDGCAGRW